MLLVKHSLKLIKNNIMEVFQKVKPRVYKFGDKQADGSSEMKNLLGGKGANLAEMSAIGIPVPPGFTITTEVCTEYNLLGQEAVVGMIKEEVEASIAKIESQMGTAFGDKDNPLLVSVRSGARVSMPGMMDTVLNLGMNDEVVLALHADMLVLSFLFRAFFRWKHKKPNFFHHESDCFRVGSLLVRILIQHTQIVDCPSTDLESKVFDL